MAKSRIALLFIVLAALAGCSSPKADISSDVPDPGKPTILVALLKNSQTQYKADLVGMLKRDFGDAYNVAVKEVAQPSDLEGENFQALVVMDKLKAWLLFNRGLKKFAALPDQSRTVYFVSCGDAKWRWKGRPDLKVVTGATDRGNAAETYPELRALLEAILRA